MIEFPILFIFFVDFFIFLRIFVDFFFGFRAKFQKSVTSVAFQSNLRKQFQKLPKFLKFVKIIKYYSISFNRVLSHPGPRIRPPCASEQMWSAWSRVLHTPPCRNRGQWLMLKKMNAWRFGAQINWGYIANLIQLQLRFPSCKNGAQRGSFSVVVVHDWKMIHAHSGTAKIWSTQQIEIAEGSFFSFFLFFFRATRLRYSFFRALLWPTCEHLRTQNRGDWITWTNILGSNPGVQSHETKVTSRSKTLDENRKKARVVPKTTVHRTYCRQQTSLFREVSPTRVQVEHMDLICSRVAIARAAFWISYSF